MTDPISFDPFLGWVDILDPNNVPPDVRTINAGDLLRYENFGVGAASRINTLITEVEAAGTPAWTDVTDKPTTFAPAAHTHVGADVALATTTAQGSMSAADKAKLDNATSTATVDRLVLRDAEGRASFIAPTVASHAATKGYVDSVIGTLMEHSEWTASQSIPQSTPSGPGTLTRDTEASENDSFISTPGADRITLAAGLYSISLYLSSTAVIASGSLIQLKNDADTVVFLENTPANALSWWMHLNIPNFRVTASTTYRFRFVNEGAAQTWASRVRVSKLR
jgi:hypothetical protein